MIWTVASFALAAVSVGAAIGLGVHARSLAHQRDAARAERDQTARDAARAAADTNAASSAAVRSLDARLAQSLDQLAELRTTQAQTARERDTAQLRRDQSLEELAALRAQLDAQSVSMADQDRALRETIRQHEARIATLTDRLDARTLAHAQSLVDLAQAELDLGMPARARDHAVAAASLVDHSTPLALRARRAQILALIQLRDPLAVELASGFAHRPRAESSQLDPDRLVFDRLVVEAMLVLPSPDPDRLIARARRLLDQTIEHHGPDSPDRWQAASLLGEALTRAGQPARAARVLAEALKAQLADATLDDPNAQLTQVRLAEALIAMDRSAEGQALLAIVIQTHRQRSASPITRRAQHDLDALAQPADATRLASESGDAP